MNNNLGRDKLPWGEDLWARIDQEIHDEVARTSVGRRFLPLVPSADALTVPADTINIGVLPGPPATSVLVVEEALVIPVIEIWVEFALTKQQVEAEATLSTAVTLTTRAANLLSQGEDLLLFQGDGAIKDSPLFTSGKVQTRAGPGPDGLANEEVVADKQKIPVPFANPGGKTYGENTFAAVAKGYSVLQELGHYGPYALVLPTNPYADAYAPLKSTLIMPADRIMPLVDQRFYGTGTLPPLVGVLASLGGNTLDLVVSRDATAAFVQEDNQGLYRFRVFERFALRDKDPTGRVLLVFES